MQPNMQLNGGYRWIVNIHDVFSLLTSQGQEYTLADLCVESAEYSGTTCSAESVLSKWEYSSALLDAETDLTLLDTVRYCLRYSNALASCGTHQSLRR